MDNDRSAGLDRAHAHALEWLDSLAERPVPPRLTTEEVAARLDRVLPDAPTDAATVVGELAAACDPGLTAIPGGRFFGFVIGGTHPAALAVDWLVSAWDQNAGLRLLTPAHSAVEDLTESWLLDLLGLPPGSAVGFVTGGTMANFTCRAAARDEVLRRHGWDLASQGLVGSPGVRVLAGAERHDTIDLALRYLGLGAPSVVPADDQGRIRVDLLEEALTGGDGSPTIVVLQAGNVHSGAFDAFTDAVAAAHRHGAWVHVDGAFGLWASASPATRHPMAGASCASRCRAGAPRRTTSSVPSPPSWPLRSMRRPNVR
jgi:glutamate/tyrosine decarboxylase-like PLP-dependent enzyme